MKITKGQTVSITASGIWNFGWECDPNGIDVGYYYDYFLNSNAPSLQGELLAFVGPQSTDPYQGHWGDGSFFPQPTEAGYWAIGSSATFTADRDGELWLGINDDAVSEATSDNNGSVLATITVSEQPVLPVAKFSAKPTSGKAPLTVAFTDKSTGTPTKWKWTFGDGTSSTTKNPKHKYLVEGNYIVSLKATNDAGSNTKTLRNYIKVTTNTRPGLYSKNK